MKENAFLLRPSGKDYLWGGTRLNDIFGKNIPVNPFAETWECSTHPEGPSYIVGGEYAGKTLSELLSEHPEYVGTGFDLPAGNLPILIKLIDAESPLSVQVHPDDKYAMEHENGSLGKTEMWYVIDADPGASLVYGLKAETDSRTLRQSIEDGTIMELLNVVPVKRGDVFFIEAGTIHTIGAGVVLAEIQQSSNLTYRLYDYGRKDKDGKLRELHIDKAIAVADLDKSKDFNAYSHTEKSDGIIKEHLCTCKYFSVEKLSLDGTCPVKYTIDESSYRVLLCLEGKGRVGDLDFKKGDCVFLPAGNRDMELLGNTELLSIKG